MSSLLIPLGWLAEERGVGPGSVPLLDSNGRIFWLAALVVAFVAGILFQLFGNVQLGGTIDIKPDRSNESPANNPSTRWILPLLSMVAGILVIAVYQGTVAIGAAFLVGFLSLVTGLAAERQLNAEDENMRGRALLVHVLLTHVLAFALFSLIYINKVRSFFSASAVMIIAILLFVHLLVGERAVFGRRIAYSLVGGIVLAEVTWALNYWPATGWTGGAVLLVFFYFIAGLLLTYVRSGVGRRDIVEYGAVSTLALTIIAWTMMAT